MHISARFYRKTLAPWPSGNKVTEANRGTIPETGVNIAQYALARALAMYGGLAELKYY